MKRNLSMLVLTAVLAPLFFTSGSLAAARVGGDLDGDGIVTAADAAIVLRAADGAVELDNALLSLADVSGNLSVSRADAAAILLYASERLDGFDTLVGYTGGALLGEKYLDKFSYHGIVCSDDGYHSGNVSITIRLDVLENASVYVADIYLRDITSFRTAFAGGSYASGRALTQKISASVSAILAANGDGVPSDKKGPLVRNGQWIRENTEREWDVCVLYRDGVMETYEKRTVQAAEVAERDPYQSWVFGPALLDAAGQAKKDFHCDSDLLQYSARTGIGYYEPGHYCIVVVDATNAGLTMREFSAYFAALGCRAAYNLPGGDSSVLAMGNKTLNEPHGGGRTTADIFYIVEPQPLGIAG